VFVADDLLSVLTRFHRDVLRPDFERMLGDVELRLRDEMQTGFDALAQRLDKLEPVELKALVEGLQQQVRALEERLSS